MPKNLQTRVCEPIVTSALDSIDRCAEADANNCNSVVIEENETEALSWETARLQEPLSSIIANQEIIYNYIQESVNSLNKSISELQNAYVSQSSEKNIVDEKQQQKLQLQAQIEALQSEMANL